MSNAHFLLSMISTEGYELMSVHHAPRGKFTPIAIVTGLVGSLIIAGSLGASLSGFIATINNATNTAATAAMAIAETSGAATCNSYDATATCTTINKFGGVAVPMVPGGSQTITVTFTNTGSVPVTTGALTESACVATTTAVVGATTPTTPNTTAGNACSVLNVAVYKAATATGTALYNGPISGFTASIALGALATAANQPWTFVTSYPAATTGPAAAAVQGQQISMPMTWTFNQ